MVFEIKKICKIMIFSKTPFRISLFGGGTDFPEWFSNNKSLVISATINKYATIGVRYLPPFFEKKYRIVWSKIDLVNHINKISHPAVKSILKYTKEQEGIELHHYGDLPARSGLGTSSSFAIGLLNIINHLQKTKISKQKLAIDSINIERNILKEKGGWQDQVIIANGGLKFIEFYDDKFSVSNTGISKKKIKNLGDSLVLFYTGSNRDSYKIQKFFLENIKNLDSQLNEINSLAIEGKKIISSGQNFNEIGRLLHESWKIKKYFSKKVSNPKIDFIYDKGMKAGATGGKLLGAGKSGFILFYCSKGKQKNLISKLKGFIHVPFNFVNHGSRIIDNIG